MATQTQTQTGSVPINMPGRKILKLDSAKGPVYREISTAAPRAATAEEIPVIDLTNLSSENVEDRKAIALKIKEAAEKTGFFYIKNHGVEEQVIENAKSAAIKYARPQISSFSLELQAYTRQIHGTANGTQATGCT